MDFLNNLITSLKNYFAPQQQAPVNAIQPWQWPVAPVQQSVDYNAVAWQPIQQIQLPEIQIPQILEQNWPVAPVQQSVDYNSVLANNVPIQIPWVVDYNTVAQQPITQAQPFQLAPNELFQQGVNMWTNSPTLQEQITQQQIQQQNIPQQTIWAPTIDIPKIGAWSMAWIQKQINKDMEWNIVMQEQKEAFAQQTTLEWEKQRIVDEAKKTEQQQAIDNLKEQYWEQKAFEIVQEQNKIADETFQYENQKLRDELYAKWDVLWWIKAWWIWFLKWLSDFMSFTSPEERSYTQTFQEFYWKEAPSLNIEAKTLEEIKRGQQVRDWYNGAAKPFIESRNVYNADIAYRVKQWTISPEEAKSQTDFVNDTTDKILKRMWTFSETLYRNWLDEEKTKTELWIGTKFLTYSAYVKQDMQEWVVWWLWSFKYNDNISPEDALKWQIAIKRLWDPYASPTYAWSIVSSALTLFSLATFAWVKWALYDNVNTFWNVTWIRPLEVGWIVDLLWWSQLQQADQWEIRTIWKWSTQTAITMLWDRLPEIVASIWVEVATTKGVWALWKMDYIVSPTTVSLWWMKYLVSPTTAAWRNYNRVVNVVNSLDVFVGSQVQNAVIEAAISPLWDNTPMSYALNPFFDVVWWEALKKFTYKPLSLDLNQLVDWNWTQLFLRATAIDNLNKKAWQKAWAWTDTAIKDEMSTIQKVTQDQVDNYRSTVEASARWLVQLQKSNPTVFNKLFKQKVGEQLMLDMASKYDGTTASKIQLTWLLNDIANADIGTAEMVGRALWTWGIIHSMDWTSFNPLNLDAWTYWLFKQWVRDVPQDVVDTFWDKFSVTWKIDTVKLEQWATNKWVDTIDMVDNNWKLTIEWVRKLWIKMDGDILAKFAKGDEELLIRSVAEKTWVSSIEWKRAINRMHDIIWDIVC
jgi:hypothetical protein